MKQKTKKLLASICMGAVVLTSVPAVSWADTAVVPANEQSNEIAPYMLYIEGWGNALNIRNGNATVDCWVEGNVNDATKAKVIAELQVNGSGGWTPVAIWTDTQNDYRASVYETKSVTKGNTYRVKATLTVWEGSQSESKTVYSGEKTA